jgi:hypothetical protein
MAKKPKLIINYDRSLYPVTAICSACQEQMRQGPTRATTSADNAKWFAERFKIHVAQKHPATS